MDKLCNPPLKYAVYVGAFYLLLAYGMETKYNQNTLVVMSIALTVLMYILENKNLFEGMSYECSPLQDPEAMSEAMPEAMPEEQLPEEQLPEEQLPEEHPSELLQTSVGVAVPTITPAMPLGGLSPYVGQEQEQEQEQEQDQEQELDQEVEQEVQVEGEMLDDHIVHPEVVEEKLARENGPYTVSNKKGICGRFKQPVWGMSGPSRTEYDISKGITIPPNDEVPACTSCRNSVGYEKSFFDRNHNYGTGDFYKQPGYFLFNNNNYSDNIPFDKVEEMIRASKYHDMHEQHYHKKVAYYKNRHNLHNALDMAGSGKAGPIHFAATGDIFPVAPKTVPAPCPKYQLYSKV